MPEGDSVAGHAERLRPILLGQTITEVGGTASSVRANSHRILDATVAGVRTAGKNLLIDLSAPTVDVDRTPAIEAGVSRLGPDVLGEFDEDEFVRRARTRDDLTMTRMLLDQRVLAGIGNVYKSELLFLERIHPQTPVRRVGDEQLRSIARRARTLRSANVGTGPRSTTGARGPAKTTWVYGRSGRPCRRCGTGIEQERESDRVTYWCPNCQPPVAGGA